MNDQLAVDVVLLPPEEVIRTIVNLISYTPNSVINFNTQNCLPHISLGMGVLKSTDIEAAKTLLERIAKRNTAVNVSLVNAKTQTIPGNLKIADVTVDKDESLLSLQKDVLDTFEPLLTHDNVTTKMFKSPPEVANISTSWVQGYYQNSKKTDGFRPHITLGEGQVSPINAPITFKAERLALCHLGNYCTCQEILAEVHLG